MGIFAKFPRRNRPNYGEGGAKPKKRKRDAARTGDEEEKLAFQHGRSDVDNSTIVRYEQKAFSVSCVSPRE